MNRKLAIALVTAVIGTGAAFTASWVVVAVTPPLEPPAARPPAAMLQPDTGSPNWRALSNDLGIMLRKDDTFGLRGRLYARVDGVWRPVPVDGLGDIGGVVPVR